MNNETRLKLLEIQKSNIENIIKLDIILYGEVLSHYNIVLDMIEKEIDELKTILLKGE